MGGSPVRQVRAGKYFGGRLLDCETIFVAGRELTSR